VPLARLRHDVKDVFLLSNMRRMGMPTVFRRLASTLQSSKKTSLRTRVQGPAQLSGSTKGEFLMERDQIITYLLQQCDAKNQIIAELQKQLAEFQKNLAEKDQSKQSSDKEVLVS
jgi:hypothetical protein